MFTSQFGIIGRCLRASRLASPIGLVDEAVLRDIPTPHVLCLDRDVLMHPSVHPGPRDFVVERLEAQGAMAQCSPEMLIVRGTPRGMTSGSHSVHTVVVRLRVSAAFRLARPSGGKGRRR